MLEIENVLELKTGELQKWLDEKENTLKEL